MVKKSKNAGPSKDSKNPVIVIAALLLIVALSAAGYFVWKAKQDKGADGSKTAAGAETGIEPGNPVVAKVGGQDITRLEVVNIMQKMPENIRQLPIQNVYPMALEQIINAKIIEEKVATVDLENDETVQARLQAAKEQIVRSVFLEQQVDKKMSEERLKKAYAEYQKDFPKVEEVRARHILVPDEEKAKELLKRLQGGESFEKLAKENSQDGTAAQGGDLGYFTLQDVVPAFGEAAFALKPGELAKEPVKSQYGYHIVKVEDKRIRPVPPYEELKPSLEQQVRRTVLSEVLEDWRDKTKIERFDINGKPIEPAAGE